MRPLLTAMFVASAGATPDVRSQHGVWTAAAPLPVPASSQVTVALAGGAILMTGGEPADDALPDRVVQRYDVTTNKWTRVADMTQARIGHTATVMANGRVLVIGGLGHKLNPLRSAEIFDPQRGTWARIPPLPETRFSHSAALLPDGRVLVVGGIVGGAISRNTLLYSPSANEWSAGPLTTYPHAQQATTVLTDGRVMLAGGYGGGPEIYDPRTGAWTIAGAVPFRTHPVMALLPNGRIFLTTGVALDGRRLTSSEVFDPRDGTWSSTEALRPGRDAPLFSTLPDGDVLVAGGGGQRLRVLRSAELYHPESGRWSATGSLRVPRAGATANLLPGGRVLACGGVWDGRVLDSCEIYRQ